MILSITCLHVVVIRIVLHAQDEYARSERAHSISINFYYTTRRAESAVV